VANELWIARETLSKQGARTDLTSSKNGQGYTWSGYCKELDIARSTLDNWLKRWFPEALTLEIKPTAHIASYEEWLPEQDQGSRQTERPKHYRNRPTANWD